MIFTSFEYVLFFAAVLLIRSRITNFGAEKWFLLGASYLFYMSWNVQCVLLILISSLLDYFVGMRLGKTEALLHRKVLLGVSLVVNLGMLGFFKYANFFMGSVGSGAGLFGIEIDPVHYQIILPVGISFFTFQSMSYTIDVYRRKMEPTRSMRDFLLYVSFFPQLVAGPIVRAQTFLPQLQTRRRPSVRDFETGLAQFALGAVKKLVISDQISPTVDMIFSAPGEFDAITLVQGVLGFAILIYCDFSGYSDMAIGSARMMGFKFLQNFQMPYKAVTITEFWRRWHISLSTWLRDYLYIPLGGNRHGVPRMYLHLMVTMLLGGLWHGASWNFVLWGGIHGAALAIHKAWMVWAPLNPVEKGVGFQLAWMGFSRVLTLAVVCLGWIFFRAETWADSMQYLKGIAFWQTTGTRLMSPHILASIFGVAAVHVFFSKDRVWAEEIPRRGPLVRILAYSSLLILLGCLAATDSAPFIYFQF